MTINRRRFLTVSIAGLAAACSSSDDDQAGSSVDVPDVSTTTSTSIAETTTTVAPLVDAPPFDGDDPFQLGIASGDPDDNSVVLWTRLITEIGDDLDVAVDVARDDAFTEVMSSTVVSASASDAHSVHVLATALDADSWFFYRFRIGAHQSAVGRTRTAPAEGSTPLRFGFSSCQNCEQGAYGAHRHLAEEDLDLFVWLGDYIYESGPNDQGVATATGPRLHDGPEITDLDSYRRRYAQYKSDPSLQANHAARPWLVTWDDHEVDNNYAASTSQDDDDPTVFNQRRREAYKAWWEHQPVRFDPPALDVDEPFIINRTFQWGDLLDLHLLDGRQFRDDQPSDGEPVDIPGAGGLGIQTLGATASDPQQSMLGLDQRQWLIDQVTASTATWSTLANQVYMHGLTALPGESPTINPDSWDGYAGERQVLLDALAAQTNNLVVLTGDFHAATVAELRSDPFDTALPVVATEFMAPAISSRFPEQLLSLAPIVLAFNPQIQHFDATNGYMTCAVDETTWTTTLHVLDDSGDEGSAATAPATFTVAAGIPGIATSTIEPDNS